MLIPEQLLLSKAEGFVQAGEYENADQVLKKLIELDSSNVHAYLLQAQIYGFQGQLYLQQSSLEKILLFDSGSAQAHLKLAQVSSSLGNNTAASKYAVDGYYLLDSSEDLVSLGSLFLGLGMFDERVKAYQKALKDSPQDAEVYYLLGDALAVCGRHQDAKRAFEKALSLQPQHEMALSAVGQVSKATKAENRVRELRSATEQQRNPWLGINLVHGLARELHDIDDYEGSFEVLAKGKQRLLAIYPFNPHRGVVNVRKLSQLFQQKIGSAEEQHSDRFTDDKPIFVVGMPRSGTTVVERILSSKNEVRSIGERHELSRALKIALPMKTTNFVDVDLLETHWDHLDFQKIGIAYLDMVAYMSKGSASFVDKLPLNFLLSGVIAKALPQAKIVCLLRNPIDTIIGNYRQLFEYNSGMYGYSLDFASLIQFVFAFREFADTMQTLMPNSFKIVEYERLVNDPKAVGEELFYFCGLDWQDQFINIQDNRAPVGTASSVQVQEPIHNRAIDHSQKYAFCYKYIRSIANQNNLPIEAWI